LLLLRFFHGRNWAKNACSSFFLLKNERLLATLHFVACILLLYFIGEILNKNFEKQTIGQAKKKRYR